MKRKVKTLVIGSILVILFILIYFYASSLNLLNIERETYFMNIGKLEITARINEYKYNRILDKLLYANLFTLKEQSRDMAEILVKHLNEFSQKTIIPYFKTNILLTDNHNLFIYTLDKLENPPWEFLLKTKTFIHLNDKKAKINYLIAMYKELIKISNIDKEVISTADNIIVKLNNLLK